MDKLDEIDRIGNKIARRIHAGEETNRWKTLVVVLMSVTMVMGTIMIIAATESVKSEAALKNEIITLRVTINESQHVMHLKRELISNMSEESMEMAIRIVELEDDNTYYRELADFYMKEHGKLHAYVSPFFGQDLEFLNIIEEVASERMYDEDEYNCVDFSRENVKRLRDYGYAARTLKVTTDCDSETWSGGNCEDFDGRHMISVICLPLEGTPPINMTGGAHIIPVWQYKDYGIKTWMLN